MTYNSAVRPWQNGIQWGEIRRNEVGNMRKELDYFWIDSAYGGIQDWFPERMMRLGGCAIVTACDSCIYLQKHRGGIHFLGNSE